MAKAYECLNCGFKFREPLVVWRVCAWDGEVAWVPATPYYPVARLATVCPRCGSDLIRPIEVEEG